jgi:hypothetical protein
MKLSLMRGIRSEMGHDSSTGSSVMMSPVFSVIRGPTGLELMVC